MGSLLGRNPFVLKNEALEILIQRITNFKKQFVPKKKKIVFAENKDVSYEPPKKKKDSFLNEQSDQCGIQMEKKTVQEMKIKHNQQKFSRNIYGRFVVQGRVDGFSKSGNYVIEIKTRKNRLYGKVWENELVQIYYYMFITRTCKCKIIERLHSDLEQCNEFYVHWCDKKWDDIYKDSVELFKILEQKLPNQIAEHGSDDKCGNGTFINSLSQLPVRELKKLMDHHNTQYSDCLEKKELVARILDRLDRTKILSFLMK